MRVILHRSTDNVRNLHKATIIHLEKRMHDTALYRLEAIYKIGDGSVSDYIGGILQKIITV